MTWHEHAVEVLPYDAPREQWLEARKLGVGASDASAVVGMNPYTSVYAVWLDKLGQVSEQPSSWPMRRGNALEADIAVEFSQQTGLELERVGLLRSKQWPWMQASLDFRVVGQPHGVECKSTGGSYHTTKEWANDEVPTMYVIQALAQMAVTGDVLTYLPVDLGSHVEYRIIDRNQRAIENLVEQCRLFWESVQTETEPEASATDISLLEARHVPVPDTPMQITPLVSELVRQRATISRRIRELEKEKKEITAVLKQQIGDHDAVVAPSGDAILWHQETARAGYTTKDTTIRNLRLTPFGKDYING